MRPFLVFTLVTKIVDHILSPFFLFFFLDVARTAMDKCIDISPYADRKDEEFWIEFYYELLEDSFSLWENHSEWILLKILCLLRRPHPSPLPLPPPSTPPYSPPTSPLLPLLIFCFLFLLLFLLLPPFTIFFLIS